MSLFNINDELCTNNVLNLKEVLMGFTINALLDQPDCIYPYAAKYFKRKQERDQPITIEITEEEFQDEEPHEAEEPEVSREDLAEIPRREKKRTVYAEGFNPEFDDYDVDIPVHPKTHEERELIYEAMRKCILFRAVDDVYMEPIIEALYPRDVVPNEIIINQGDEGDNFYVIESGIYDVWMIQDPDPVPELITTYSGFGSFGELALMYNQPRAASVKAVTEGRLWVMERKVFKKMVLKAIYKKRAQFEDLIAKVPMLDELQPYERSSLADAMEEKRFQQGDVIIKQGDEADGMYFMIDGSVSVSIEQPGTQQQREVAVLKEGDYFGELALVTHNPRAATVTAVEKTKTAFLDKEAFERILGPCLDIMARNKQAYKEQTAKIFGAKQPGRT